MEELSYPKRILYVCLIVFFCGVMYFTFSSELSNVPKIAGMAMIPIAAAFFLVKPEPKFSLQLLRVPGMMMIQLAVIIIASAFIWIADIQKLNYMSAGLKRLLFQTINIAVVFSSVYVLRKKTVEVAFWAAAIFNIYRVLMALRLGGASHVLSDITATMKSGDQVGFLTYLELNMMTYSMGLFAIYFTMFDSGLGKKKRIIYAIIANVLFFLGFKRIGLFALAIAYVIYIICKFLPEKKARHSCMFVGILFVVLMMIYVPFVRYDLFTKVLGSLNISTNARSSLYEVIKDQYEFSPTFRGHGFSYVTEYLAYLKTLNAQYVGEGAHFIHNDILVYYVELGFWGFLAWAVYNCIFMQWWFSKNFGAKIGTLYCAMNAYNYLTYLTDNTATSYIVNTAFRIILLTVVCVYIGHGEIGRNSEFDEE